MKKLSNKINKISCLIFFILIHNKLNNKNQSNYTINKTLKKKIMTIKMVVTHQDVQIPCEKFTQFSVVKIGNKESKKKDINKSTASCTSCRGPPPEWDHVLLSIVGS
jgi:hypothetical protein